MTSEVMSYRLNNDHMTPSLRSVEIPKQLGLKGVDLWTGLQERPNATLLFNNMLGHQKEESVLDSLSEDEDRDLVIDSYLSTGPSRLTGRLRCQSAAASDSRIAWQDSSLLSTAQKAGCYSYIKQRHSIALAFASDSPRDDSCEPQDISTPGKCVMPRSNWKAVKVKHGVQLFKSKRSRCEVRGVTQVNASVKNVMSILAAGKTTEDFAEAQKTLLGTDQVLEAKVLATCAEPTSSQYFHCGLKYLAIKNPFATTPLDLVYLDYTDVGTTFDGKLIGYRILESIRVPALQASSKYVRASIRCEVYTVVETDTPGVVEVTFASHLDPKSKCSSNKRSSWLEQAGVRLANLRAYAEKTSIGHHLSPEYNSEIYRRQRLSASEAQPKCNVCQHFFSFLRKRHNCRICGESSCGRCCRKMPVLVDTESTRVKVCLSCILHSRNNPDEIRRGELNQLPCRRDITTSTFIIYDE